MQINGFRINMIDTVKFEKSLTPKEVERFKAYMIYFHAIRMQNKRFRELLEKNNIDISNEREM